MKGLCFRTPNLRIVTVLSDSYYTNKVNNVSNNTAPITPLAIASFFNFNKMVKVIKFNKDPRVIIFPKKPAVFSVCIPLIKSISV